MSLGDGFPDTKGKTLLARGSSRSGSLRAPPYSAFQRD
jgi:hypothetical protein